LATGEGRFEEAVDLCRAAVAGFDAAEAPPPVRFAARFALADAYVAVGDLAGAAALGAVLDDPDADGDLAARGVAVAAAAAGASLRAQAGDVAGAERELAEVGDDWRAWGVWAVQTARAAVAAARGDAGATRAAAERALMEAERWPYYDRAHCVALVAPTLAQVG